VKDGAAVLGCGWSHDAETVVGRVGVWPVLEIVLALV
jgi:hypothetical protein